MILIAFGFFLSIFYFCGAEWVVIRQNLLVFAGSLLAISLFYGWVWTMARSETPGMRWTHLRLTNFDGFPPDAGQRMVRFLGACLSFAALGLGILWALVDEESLTWHDHISKTFPSLPESQTNFFRPR